MSVGAEIVAIGEELDLNTNMVVSHLALRLPTGVVIRVGLQSSDKDRVLEALEGRVAEPAPPPPPARAPVRPAARPAPPPAAPAVIDFGGEEAPVMMAGKKAVPFHPLLAEMQQAGAAASDPEGPEPLAPLVRGREVMTDEYGYPVVQKQQGPVVDDDGFASL
jgi:hypothetical protein